MVSLVGSPALIVDATNSSASKETLLKYAQGKNIPVMSIASDSQNSELKIVMPGEDYAKALLEGYNGRRQGAIPSEVMAGVLTEEARKILMPLQNESVVRSLAYSAGRDSRFSKTLEELSGEIEGDFRDKRVLVVGAGALGNFVGLGLTLAGVGNVDLLDYDDVESTNLNRQVLFYDAVGKMKAEALAQKLGKINPKIKVKGIVGKLDINSKFEEGNRYDLIMDCVDSFAVRAIINYFAIRNNTPLVSGGTDPNAGQVSVYVPGESACLDCKLGVEKALARQMASSSCRYTPDPSVIMTNEIIGGLMVGEAMKVLDPKYGKPVTRILKYDSKAPSRGGLIGLGDKCDCVKPEVKEWLEQVKGKYKPEGEK
jgi:molybdopterin/thiamine biosynthesis adenylyltransferase